jgi:hypothetical protein
MKKHGGKRSQWKNGSGAVKLRLPLTRDMRKAFDVLKDRLGIAKSYIKGGAIRDAMLGAPVKDYDMFCDLWDLADKEEYSKFEDPTVRNFDENLLGMLIKKKFNDAGIPVLYLGEINSFRSRRERRCLFESEGLIFDLLPDENFDLMDSNIGISLVFTDAAINAVMASSDGEYYAHQLFTRHLKNRICMPYQQDDLTIEDVMARFEYLKGKIPDLKLLFGDNATQDLIRPHSDSARHRFTREIAARWAREGIISDQAQIIG